MNKRLESLISNFKRFYEKSILQLCDCGNKAVVMDNADPKRNIYCYACLNKRENGKADEIIKTLEMKYSTGVYG